MPLLPSCRNIAIRLDPRAELLRDAEYPGDVHRFKAVTDASGLAPYVEILLLDPRTTVWLSRSFPGHGISNCLYGV